MNMKKIVLSGLIVAAAIANALDYVEVIDVRARQRYPWNGLVDIDFELDSRATEPYQMKVTVFDNVGKTNLNVKSVYTENVSYADNPCMVAKGTSRIVWDAAADLPEGFKCTNVLVTCQDTRAADCPDRYLIVDLSGGSGVAKFPVSYRSNPPEGGWTEDYMTQKMVLRRVDPSSFNMGSRLSEEGHMTNEVCHRVTLTKPYYVGIYEVSAAQFALVMGMGNMDTQPVQTNWYTLRGVDVSIAVQTNRYTNIDGIPSEYLSNGATNDFTWPFSDKVSGTSFFGRLRTKTGLRFDLPTEAQWECACRAGSDTPLNIGMMSSVESESLVKGGAKFDSTGSHLLYVGQYMPNSLGVYDMHGNVPEWCLDIYVDNLGESDVIDPIGGDTFLKNICVYDSWGYASGERIYLDGYDRVIRGHISRSAARMSARVLNDLPWINRRGFHSEYSGVRYKYVDPIAGIRVALTVQ